MAKKINAKNNGSVRQRADGRWEARIMINGVRKSFYGKRQSDAVKAMRSAKTAVEKGTYFEPKRITVANWLKTWLKEYIEPSCKPSTVSMYENRINTHIIPALGNIKLNALNPTQIQTFYNDLLRVKKLSPTTIKADHAILHEALERAVKLHYIEINPTNACTLPRNEKREIKPLTEKEIVDFLHEIENGEPLKDLFTVALFTGMREGEICGLPWEAVNFIDGTITVKQQLCKENKKGGAYYISTPKSNKSRTLTVAPFIMDILKRVFREQNENRLLAGLAWNNEWNLVFTNKLGQYIVPNVASKRFKKVAKRIGREDARFHDLRHTYAVTALQEGDDVKTVQENLGHATASFTLDVYGHKSEKMDRASAERMHEYHKKISG